MMASEDNDSPSRGGRNHTKPSLPAVGTTSIPPALLPTAVTGMMGGGGGRDSPGGSYAASFCATGSACPSVYLGEASVQRHQGDESRHSIDDSLVGGVSSCLSSLDLSDKKASSTFGALSFAQLASLGMPTKQRQPASEAIRVPPTTSPPTSGALIGRKKTSMVVPPTESHVPIRPVYAPTKSNELCHFAMVGKCRYGDLCKNIHGLQCPRCLRYCLHPHDVNKNEEHIEECLGKEHISSPHDVSNIECGICLAKISQKDDPRFGLMNCDHAFCLHCIRTWRSQHSMSDLTTKSCPLCRTVTFFVIPSSTWTTELHEKLKIVEAYKRKVGEIDCKYFNHGNGECPFSHSCFYAHRTRGGPQDDRKPVVRAYTGKDEKLRAIREPRLSDFIDFHMGKSTRSKK